MTILFTTDQTYLHGGIEKIMAAKANYLAEVMEYEVHILTTEQKRKEPCYPLSKKIRHVDLGVNYSRKKSYFHPANLSKMTWHFRMLKMAIKNINPDVIIVCNYAFDFYRLPYIATRIPKLKEYHSSGIVDKKARENAGKLKKWQYKLNDYIESKYDRLILLNPDEKKFYKSDNVVIIPNFVDIPDFQAPLNNKKAIAAGRIAPVKGFENLIRAWQIVVKEQPEWEVHIYGQGEPDYIRSLHELIKAKGLEKNVIIKPATYDLVKTMADYSIYVMSSLTECFPMVLLESLSVGLPIVSFDCETGPRNIVTNHEDGLLSEDQNVEALAKRIIQLAADETLRKAMGNQAVQNAARFSKTEVMSKWVDLFNELKHKN